MAKSKKKPAAKPAKKAVSKAKSAAKAKKAAPAKSKKPAKKKPQPKKAIAKKPVAKPAVKKAAPKKAVKAAKVAPKKVVKEAPKAKVVKAKVVKEVVVKEVKVKAPKKVAEPKEPKPVVVLPKKPVPQLTIFPIVNQRPIAHKQANPSTMSEDKTRYSEVELKEFEALILSKLEKSREEFRILKDTLNRTNDAGTDATSGGNTKVLEDGAETAEKENLSQLAARQLKYITNLENALVRIKNGTYGICSVTGKLIPKERLIAVPHTTQSIEAKMMKQD
jgi:RNA polymerase-binding transcription factor DksA